MSHGDVKIVVLDETRNCHILPLFFTGFPLGGVTGRPVWSPPYGNFFLSAGFNIYNLKEK